MPCFNKTLLCWLLLYPFTCFSNTQEDFQTWLNITAIGTVQKQDKTPSKIKYWLEGQERVGDDSSRTTQTLARTGLGYALTNNLSLWLGYGWIHTSYPLTRSPFEENRIWEQLLWTKTYSQFTLTSRTRLEQRFLENTHKTAYRARQLFKIVIPLHQNSKISLVSSDELFIHKNNFSGTASRGFDQNRAFIGFGYRFNPSLVTEIGYMNQYIRRVGVPNFVANIASINLLVTL